MRLWDRIRFWRRAKEAPQHLQRGQLGERAARFYLQQRGLKFLSANYRTKRGEIDLVFRDQNCLVFAEVKTRSVEGWVRPAAAVNAAKRRRLSRVAMHYCRRLKSPYVLIRFDIVEVLLKEGVVVDVRHLPNVFPLSPPYRYG